MAKYTKEEKQKAIDLYIRYCRQATKVIKELGYPNERHTLVSWYRGYEEKGEVKDDGREEKKLSLVYSEDHIHAAVSFYIEDRKSTGKECLSDSCSFWYVHDDSRYGVALFLSEVFIVYQDVDLLYELN